MKNLVEKIGMDKIAHFGVGGLICAMITFTSMIQEGATGWRSVAFPLIGYVVVFIISIMKEAIIDGEFNFKDIIASMIGCVLVHISVLLGVIFNILSA